MSKARFPAGFESIQANPQKKQREHEIICNTLPVDKRFTKVKVRYEPDATYDVSPEMTINVESVAKKIVKLDSDENEYEITFDQDSLKKALGPYMDRFIIDEKDNCKHTICRSVSKELTSPVLALKNLNVLDDGCVCFESWFIVPPKVRSAAVKVKQTINTRLEIGRHYMRLDDIYAPCANESEESLHMELVTNAIRAILEEEEQIVTSVMSKSRVEHLKTLSKNAISDLYQHFIKSQ
jgi:hypothetical protein